MLPGSLHGERFRRFLKNRKAFKQHTRQNHTVDGSEIRLTTWDVSNPANNEINYQPQMVNAGFLNHQQYGFAPENQLATWGYRPILQRGYGLYGTLIMEASWTCRKSLVDWY